MADIIRFPASLSFEEYGDLFHHVMDICGDVQLSGKDHLDATGELMDIIMNILKSKGVQV